MAEIGEVIQVKEPFIKVKLQRKEACAKCKACTAGLEEKDMFIEAKNLCHAQKGDFVEIMLEEENFIKAVFFMYGLPLVSFFIGLGITILFFLSTDLGLSQGLQDVISTFVGVFCIAITYFVIHKNEHRFKTNSYRPKAIRKASAKGE